MILPIKFKGFVPSEIVKSEAEEALLHVEDYSPTSSTVSMILLFDRDEYVTAVEVFTRKGLVRTVSSEVDPLASLDTAKRAAIAKFGNTKETRFFSRPTHLTNIAQESSESLNVVQ